MSDSKGKIELRGMFVTERWVSKVKSNGRANEMRLSQGGEEVLELARDWQPCREWGYFSSNGVALYVGTNALESWEKVFWDSTETGIWGIHWKSGPKKMKQNSEDQCMYLTVAIRSPFGYFPNGGIYGVVLKILRPDSSVSTRSFNLTETERKRGK